MAKRMQSPSSINLYRQCPRRYYYRYIEKLPTQPSIHLVRGSIAHTVLERFFTIDPINIQRQLDHKLALTREILLQFTQEWKQKEEKLNALDLPKDKLTFYYKETEQMLLRFSQQFYKRLFLTMEEKGTNLVQAFNFLSPETEKRYASQEHQVMGYVDAIEILDGKVQLIDYKTSKSSTITPAYRRQLGIYALLYEDEHNKRPDAVGIHFLRTGRELLKVDEELVRDALFEVEQIHASTESNDKMDYPKKEGPLCKWSTGQCDFYEKCFS